jgi:hypothetical protein
MGRRAHHLEGALVVTARRIWIAAAVVAVAIAAVILAFILRERSKTATPRQAISGQTFLSRSAALFADPLKARIELLVDRNRVDPARVGFNPKFDPYVRIGIARLERHDTGSLTRLTYTADLACTTYACLPSFFGTRVQFTPAKVFYSQRGRPRRTLELPWFAFTLEPRTSEKDLNNADPFVQPAWRATTEPEAVSYGISPDLLRALLFVGSGLLFLCALAAFAAFVRAVAGRLRLPTATPLERAVALVEKAAAREDQPAKRKALELLSRELTHSGEGDLALAARELAWGEATPVPAATQPLTLDVRRLIAERSNGHVR